MPIKIGNTSISDVYIGNTKIKKVYQGSNLVFEKKTGFDINLYDTNDTLLYSVKSVNNKIPALPIPTKSGYIFQGWWDSKNFFYDHNGATLIPSTTVVDVIQHYGHIKSMNDECTSNMNLYAHWIPQPTEANNWRSAWFRGLPVSQHGVQQCEVYQLNLNLSGDTLPDGTVIMWAPNWSGKEPGLWEQATLQQFVFCGGNSTGFFIIPGGDWYSISDLQSQYYTSPWTVTCNSGIISGIKYVQIASGYGHTKNHGIRIDGNFTRY